MVYNVDGCVFLCSVWFARSRENGAASTFSEVCRFIGVDTVGAGGFATKEALQVQHDTADFYFFVRVYL